VGCLKTLEAQEWAFKRFLGAIGFTLILWITWRFLPKKMWITLRPDVDNFGLLTYPQVIPRPPKNPENRHWIQEQYCLNLQCCTLDQYRPRKRGNDMGKVTSIEYLNDLENAAQQEDELVDDQWSDTDADALAQAAEGPAKRKDGTTITTPRQARRLTPKQLAFVAAKVEGKSNAQAYREAYPDDKSSDRVISANAYKLTKHPVIGQMLEDAWGETVEALTEDVAATKRYVLRQLLALSKGAKQEGSRLKALELMGKAVGVFTPSTETTVAAPTADQLKRELSGHLRLLGGKSV
jgi:hypothetical protein